MDDDMNLIPAVKVPVRHGVVDRLDSVVGFLVLDGPKAKELDVALSLGFLQLTVTSMRRSENDGTLIAIDIAPGNPASPEALFGIEPGIKSPIVKKTIGNKSITEVRDMAACIPGEVAGMVWCELSRKSRMTTAGLSEEEKGLYVALTKQLTFHANILGTVVEEKSDDSASRLSPER